MRISEAFPSKYISATDLQGQEHPVVISNVVMEQMGDGTPKPIVYFQGKQKGMVLNKTNSNAISVVYGDETSNWLGKTITIFPMQVEFQGKLTTGIRVKVTGPADFNAPRHPNEPLQVGDALSQSDNMDPPAGQPIGDQVDDWMKF